MDAKYALIVAKLMYKRFHPNALSDGNIDYNENEEEETPEEQEYISKYVKNFHSMKDLNMLHAIMKNS